MPPHNKNPQSEFFNCWRESKPQYIKLSPNNKEKYKAIVTGFGLSTLASLLFGTFMFVANIPATTILPTLAPIWIGLATITVVAGK